MPGIMADVENRTEARAFGRRERHTIALKSPVDDIQLARGAFDQGRFLEAVDIYEQVAAAYPAASISVLAELYDRYQQLPHRDRYRLYQSRHYDFGIAPGDKVLDIGSGHLPFPLATHLADVTLDNHAYGRAGVPFRHVEGKPVYECSVERMPFADKEFDFVYCSHVLEHVQDPETACRELIRVGQRGYIETPTKGKDIFLGNAAPSNHSRYFEVWNGKLICSEFTEEELKGLQSDILRRMHCSPQSLREKAFAALIWLKADKVNTMLLWEGSFEFEVRRTKPRGVKAHAGRPDPRVTVNPCPAPSRDAANPCTFLQVHTFYPGYLDGFYRKHPGLADSTFHAQIDALVRDGFSGIHLFAPYMAEFGYCPHLIVANNLPSQRKWLCEQGLGSREAAIHDTVRRQIECIRPSILYLSDPVTFDGRFLRSLSWRPQLVLGWRAADIPDGIDWSGFDMMLSSLAGLRQIALELGAKAAEHFFPGYPAWINTRIPPGDPEYDVVFSGSWTTNQHVRRNRYLLSIARASQSASNRFSCAYYLHAPAGGVPHEVARVDGGPRFGIDMHAAIRTGRIVVDARGSIGYRRPNAAAAADLAAGETANMRIFEVTGSGRFLLTEHYENLKDYFEPGVEIETFQDEAELIQKIRYYLAHPERREAIARRGQERCLREYSMSRRASALGDIIRRHTAAGTRSSNSVADSVALTTIQQVERLLGQGAVETAFRYLVNAKKVGSSQPGLDLLRARCFLEMQRPDDALQALREELRWFPENQAAQALMTRLQANAPTAGVHTGEDEFERVMRVIRPYTMLSEQRLASLYRLARQVCDRNILGNFVECGVAAGGSSALLAWVIKRYGRHPRKLFAFDSFVGMPPPSEADRHNGVAADSTGWGTGTCSAPETSIQEVCRQLGVAELVTTVKGFFNDTLTEYRNWTGMIACLHMDGDWYESTRSILENLYGQLSNEAVVQVDDYGHWEGCRKALHEYEAARSIRFDLKPIDGTGVWFVKPDRFRAAPDLPDDVVRDFLLDDPVRSGIESQMSPNERFQLYYALRRMLPHPRGVRRFIEIGSYAGASLHLICMGLTRMNLPYQGIAVEPACRPGFKEILRRFGDGVLHMPLHSHAASVRLARMLDPGNLPDLILIDGDHSYEGVSQDIVDFYPLLSPGGIMMFHDYLPALDERNRKFIHAHHAGSEPGIRQSCSELMETTYGLQPISLPLLYPTDPTQTQPHLPIIPGVLSTIRAYRKPVIESIPAQG